MPRLFSLLSSSVLLLTFAVISQSNAVEMNNRLSTRPVVKTRVGDIMGVLQTPTLRAFNGIPYAEPPVGDLRFKAPVAHAGWSGTLDASSFGRHCMQPGMETTASEDCLFLNILSPVSPTELLPVLFYIHGGGSEYGYGDDPLQDQSVMASELPAVTVTMNYRLNIFGYLALEELTKEGSTSGNYGVMDCQLALAWVQQNILAFGGDPRRVTVYGQSSGGTQILALLVSPASRGLFAAAVSLSGSPKIDQELRDVEKANVPVIARAGCSNATDVLGCLRKVPAAEMMNAAPWLIPPYWNMGSVIHQFGMPQAAPYECAGGLVIVDGKIVPKSLYDGLKDPLVRMEVPALFATVEAEIDFDPFEKIPGLNQQQLEDFFTQKLRAANIKESIIMQVLKQYTLEKANGNSQHIYEFMVNDLRVFCGNRIAAASTPKGYLVQSVHSPSSPCNFHMANNALFGNEQPWNQTAAFHTWDLTCMLKTVHYTSCAVSKADDDFGGHWRDLLRLLVKDPDNFNMGNGQTLLVDANGVTLKKDYRAEYCDIWEDLIGIYSWNN